MSERAPWTPGEIAQLAADCLDIAAEGAALALTGFGSRPAAREKAARDYVTDFDLRTQDLVLARLRERHPGIAVVAEEGEHARAALATGPAFAVDPIDGTTNFAHGHPFWAVSVALLWGGEPAAGAVVAPSLGLTWHGYRYGGSGRASKSGLPCGVSAVAELRESLVATGFPPDRSKSPDDNFASFVAVKRRAGAVRRCGAAAIDLCFVADGTYDGYWERRLHVWDSAAAAALVLAGGGRVTSLDGGEPDYARGHIVASNGRVHDALVAAIASDPGPIVCPGFSRDANHR
jgi:myo-inositol-1(or 4)-monophosphatase